MGVTNSNDVRSGDLIILENVIWEVVDFQHVKPGKGGAFVRLKVKNVKQGNVVDKTLNAGEKLMTPEVEENEVQFLYKSGKEYTFMDNTSFEQFTYPEDKLGNAITFLKPDTSLQLMTYKGDILGIHLPITVELEVKDTPPGFKGNTVSGSSKPATLETGAVVNVPFFINPGDVVRVDTRTGDYLERVSK